MSVMDTYQRGSMHHPLSLLPQPKYPPAEATHQQICDDYALFKVTLDRLLSAMGIKLKIPKVGGQEVDLHRLYKEVTNLGGLEPVITRKQWVTVCEPFNFPASFTNKSFVIKKLYLNALHHYEQVYFHRNPGPVVPAPTSSQEPPVVLGSNHYDRMKRKNSSHDGSIWSASGFPAQGPTTGFFRQQMQHANSFSPSISHLPPGTRFSGTVDSSFEHGYYLTLELSNGQRVQGMMYRKPAGHAVHHSQHYKADSAVITGSEHMCSDSGVHGTGCGAPEFNSKMHQQRVPVGHPGAVATRPDGSKRLKSDTVEAPNQPRSALFYFASSLSTDEVRAVHPEGDLTQATVKVAADKWNSMTLEQKQPFLDKAKADQMRYEAESARLSQAVASGCSLRPSKDSSVSDECMERAQHSEHSQAKQKVQPGGGTPHSRQGRAPEGGRPSHYDPFHAPADHHQHSTPRHPSSHPVVPPLPPSHPMAAALSAAHERAVKAAIAAGAPLPPPPHMLGIPLAPSSHAHNNMSCEEYGTGGFDHNSYFQHNYYSSESELCNQPPFHPEGNSSGPSPAVEQSRYSADESLHGPATEGHPHMEDYDHHEEEADLLQHILGDDHGGKPMRLTQDLLHDPTDEAFVRMLEAGPLLGIDHDGMMHVGTTGAVASTKGPAEDEKHKYSADGQAHHPDSPLSEHEQNYRSDFGADLMGVEGYPSSVFSAGPADCYGCDL